MNSRFFWYEMPNGSEKKVYFSEIEDLANDLGDYRASADMSDDEFYNYVHMIVEE